MIIIGRLDIFNCLLIYIKAPVEESYPSRLALVFDSFLVGVRLGSFYVVY